jgi:serine protease Do
VVSTPLLLLLLSAASFQESAKEETTLQKLEKEISGIVEKVRPSVVRVHADDLTFSGVIYSKEGHVITDASGIDRALEIRVTVGERSFTADRVDADRRTGIAVLKISAKGLLPASISAEGCKSGTQAIVVGNALGMPSCSSFCTIGGIGRSILVRGQKYENMLQMSAAVLPGDCGAFVSDSAGRLVGLVHSAGALENGDEKLVPAPAFAVPAAWVKFSADRIIKHGKMVRGWLGASLLPLSDAARSHLGLEASVGAEVTRVERESPAQKAGLAKRDILVSFDGQAVNDLEALQWKIATVEEPTKIRIVFLHNGETRTVETQIELDPQK